MADKIHIGAIIATACKVDNGPEFLKHILDNFGAFDKIKLGRGLFSAINFKNTSVAELLLEYPDTNVDARNSYGHPQFGKQSMPRTQRLSNYLSMQSVICHTDQENPISIYYRLHACMTTLTL